jgi:hypothetical protein
MMMGWQTLNNQNGGGGKRYNNLLHKGDEILYHKNCNKHEWKTQKNDLLQTLNFCNANMAHPSPTIYG